MFAYLIFSASIWFWRSGVCLFIVSAFNFKWNV